MFDWFYTLQDSDKIQTISIICTSILSIIAIIISIFTLKQNNKIIFESNKPYISIFSKIISFSSPYPYLILKNFGTTGAIIINIEYDEILNSYFDKKPFENMKNVFIAPNQSYVYPLDYNKNIDNIIHFKVTYKYLNKIYVEHHDVKFTQFYDIPSAKYHSSKDLKELSEVLQEIVIQNV